MATIREIRTLFTLKGAEEYQSKLKYIKDAQSRLNLELKKAKAEFDNHGNASAYSEKRLSLLTKKFEEQSKKVEVLKNALAEANKKYGEGSDKAESFARDVLQAETALERLRGEVKSATAEFIEQNSTLSKLSKNLDDYGAKAEQAGQKLSATGRTLTTHVTAPLLAGAGFAAKSAIDFETAFTGVRKTVDATEEEFQELEKEILELNKVKPMGAGYVAGIMETAGQLGIAKEDLKDFTSVMLDLNSATDIQGQEGAAMLARFASVAGLSTKEIANLGSALVGLGNNFATQEGPILRMSQRIMPFAKTAGIASADVLALSASLSSVGMEAEAGGTAMATIIKKMQTAVETGGKDLENFAKVAGKSAKEFQDAFRTNATGALTDFIKGLGDTNQHSESMIALLQEAGFTGVRTSQALASLASAGDLMGNAIALSNKAWSENTALTEEANKFWGTSANQLKRAKAELENMAITIGKELAPHLIDLARWVGDLAKKFTSLDKGTQKTILKILGLSAVLGPALSIIGKTTSGVGKLAKGVGGLVKWLHGLTVAKQASGALGALGESAKGAGGALGALKGVLSPTGLAIGAVAAAVGGLVYVFHEGNKAFEEGQAKLKGVASEMRNFGQGVAFAQSELPNLLSVVSQFPVEPVRQSREALETQITEINKRALAERRALTDEEFEHIKALMGELASLGREEEKTLARAGQVQRLAIEQMRQLTEADAQKQIKTAEETRDKLLAIAESKRLEELAKASEQLEQLEKQRNDYSAEEYNTRKKQIKNLLTLTTERYEEERAKAREGYGKTYSALLEQYQKLNGAELAFLDKATSIREAWTARQKKLIEEKAKADKDAVELEGLFRENAIAKSIELNRQLEDEAQAHLGKMAELFDEEAQKHAGALIAMVTDAKVHGAKIPKQMEANFESALYAISKLQPKAREEAIGFLNESLNGLKEKSPELTTQIEGLRRRMIDALNSGNAEAFNSGVFFGQGFSDGLGSMLYRVQERANALASVASNAIRQTLSIASPSKVTKQLGAWTGEGFALGLEEQAQSVGRKARALADNAVSALNRQTDSAERISTGQTLGRVGKNRNKNTAQSQPAQNLGKAMREALEGVSIKLNERELGRVVVLKK